MVAGFVPREIAKVFLNSGKDQAFAAASEYFPSEHFQEGSEPHFLYFSQLLSGLVKIKLFFKVLIFSNMNVQKKYLIPKFLRILSLRIKFFLF